MDYDSINRVLDGSFVCGITVQAHSFLFPSLRGIQDFLDLQVQMGYKGMKATLVLLEMLGPVDPKDIPEPQDAEVSLTRVFSIHNACAGYTGASMTLADRLFHENDVKASPITIR